MNENIDKPVVQKDKKYISTVVVFLLVMVFSSAFGIGGWLLGTKFADS